jgi:hypothetical protein
MELDVEAYVEAPDCEFAAVARRADPARPRTAVAAYRLTATRPLGRIRPGASMSYLDELLGGQTESRPGWPLAGTYSLQIVASRFDDCPLVLLVRDEGGTTRSYQYVLYRLDSSERLREIWSLSSDGDSHSTAHCYELSTLDFSALASGAKNEIAVSTIAGCRRVWREANVTEADLIPKTTHTVYGWSASQGRFLEVK